MVIYIKTYHFTDKLFFIWVCVRICKHTYVCILFMQVYLHKNMHYEMLEWEHIIFVKRNLIWKTPCLDMR